MSDTIEARQVEQYLARSGGRLACPHPVHRFAQVPNSPARVILPECAGRAPWLAARRDGIGGSEVAALVGLSEYDTSWSIFNKKLKAEPDEELTGAPIEWGHRLENVVAEKVAEEIGMVSRFGGGLWANPDKPFLRVTPDRFATKPRSWKAEALIECKTAGDDEHWESGVIYPRGISAKSISTGSAPLHYQAQCQWQMGIIGLKKAYLGCLVLGRERSFFTVEIDFDPEWFAELAREAERFWTENILTGEPPMHDLRHPKTEELLKTLQPKVVKPSVDLPPDTESWLADYDRAKDAVKKAEADLDAIKNYFRMMTGDAGAGYLPWPGKKDGLKITSYPEVAGRMGVDLKMLEEKYPEVYAACTRRGESHRRLTISVPKELKAKFANRVDTSPSTL